MPRETPKLVLTSARSVAVTYSFETEGKGFKSWALCTVNDSTGELLITSDWGSWSHRWPASPEALGHPTLTAFIGTRADVDYLARKLQGRRGGQRFSAEKTTKELRKLLCSRRLADGREQFERRLEDEDFVDGKPMKYLAHRFTEAGLPIFSDRLIPAGTFSAPDRTEELPYLDADTARRLWDEIESTVDDCGDSDELRSVRLSSLEGFSDYVTEAAWEYSMTEQTPEDRALRDIVLPALIEACRGSTSTEPFAVGDRVVHTNSKRKGKVRTVRTCPDGTVEMQVDIDFDDIWWNSRHVKKDTPKTEEAP